MGVHKFTKGRLIAYIVMAVYAVISIYPLVWLFFYSFKTNEEIFVTNPFGLPKSWALTNYTAALERLNILVYFMNSLIVSVCTIALTLITSLMFCYVVARAQNKLTRFFQSLVNSGLFIPIQAVMIPLVILVHKFGMTNSLLSVIIPYTALSLPTACIVLYGFYLSIPIALEESAYMDGANFGRTYFSIILPQMKSPVFVLIIYTFIYTWNELSLAMVLLTKDMNKTLPLGLAAFNGAHSTDWGVIGAALCIACGPMLIIYLFFSNQITDAMASSGVKG